MSDLRVSPPKRHRGEERITTQVILYEPPAAQSGHFLTPEPLPMDRDDGVSTARAVLAPLPLALPILNGVMM